MAASIAAARIKGALSATNRISFTDASASTALLVNAGVDNAGLAAGPLKDLLCASYAGVDVAAAQAAALAAFDAHVRVNPVQSGAAQSLTAIGYVATASAANPSKLSLAIKATSSAAFATESLDVTCQYAPSLTK
jgi:hypothetical protein